MERFRTIVADPPWHYEGGCWDRQVSRSSSHYDTLTVPETASLGAELSTFIANDAYLFLWITSRFIIEGAGKAVPEAWGFRPLTTLVWCKPQIGLGYYVRNAHELVVFGVRGSPGPFNKRDLPSWFVDNRRRHSKKPSKFYARTAQYCGGPYLELFARRQRENWTCWGKEVGDPLGIGFDPEKWRG